MKLTEQSKPKLQVFLPDTRGVEISRFGKGNLKIGPNVVTYSKQAVWSCPGRTPACTEFCYAKRIGDPVLAVHKENTSMGADVPDLPEGTKLVRFHVAGDFDSVAYVRRWIEIVKANPQTRFWGYTRSWRVNELRNALEELRALPNVQLFASMDQSVSDVRPDGWRYAWIEDDPRKEGLVCPEERGKVTNCETCNYCLKPSGQRDVIFLKH